MKSKAILATATLAIIATSIIGCTDDDNAGAGPTPVELSATVTAPINNASVNDLVEITVDATDDKGIAKVEFFVNAIKIGEDAVAPYTIFWNASSLTHGSIHSIFAVAFDTDGNKFGTAPILCTIDTTMSAPQSVTLSLPTDITDSSLTLSWSQNTDNDFARYTVSWGLTSNPQVMTNSQDIVSATDTTLNIAELQDNSQYSFQVATTDIFGNTRKSDILQAQTTNAAPPQPTLLGVVRQASNIQISWTTTQIHDFLKYEIVISLDTLFDSSDSTLISISDIATNNAIIPFSDTGVFTFFIILHDSTGLSTASSGFITDLSKDNFALQFDGSQYATIPYFPALDVRDEYTLEAWISMSSASTYMRVIDKSPTGSPWLQYSLICDPSPGADLCNGNGPVRFHANATVPLNEWRHVSLTYDNGVIIYYIDGIAVDTTITGITQSCAFNTTLNIGRRKMFNEFYFRGMIDEVRVWNTVRTPAEIGANYNKRLSGSEFGLVCYYDFDEGSGDVIFSPVGGNGHLGDVSGADAKDPVWVTSNVPISN